MMQLPSVKGKSVLEIGCGNGVQSICILQIFASAYVKGVELAEPDDRLYHASLYNLAAVETILKGGRVFLAPAEKMPVQPTELNALLRY